MSKMVNEKIRNLHEDATKAREMLLRFETSVATRDLDGAAATLDYLLRTFVPTMARELGEVKAGLVAQESES